MQTEFARACAAGAIAAALAAAGPAKADGWLATITFTPPAVKARDAGWTAIVVTADAAPLTTGSISVRANVYVPSAGPRLTGTGHALTGMASYYWQEQMTATGERFDKRALTAAHKTLPFGTKVRVTRVDTGDSVIVRINDRGPFTAGRVIDLSERAAEEIGMTGRGIAAVKLEVVGR